MLDLKQTASRQAWLVGHRGAMQYAPENTMASFETGVEMGADLVECDVHLSRDGECIVMHDEALERTTNGYGLIRDLSSGEIRRADAGAWFAKRFKGEKVPLLRELLEWAGETRSKLGDPVGVVIEVKNEPVRYAGIEQKIIDTVLEAGMQDRVIVISFDHGVVKRSKRINSKIAAGILYNRPLEDPIERARQVHADALFPRRNFITRSLAQKAHREGLAVATWTVNEVWEMKKMIACGVDAIASNVPDKLNKLLKVKK